MSRISIRNEAARKIVKHINKDVKIILMHGSSRRI